MLGAIIGDIAGSTFEFHPIKTKEVDFFEKKSTYSDDTVLTIALAKALSDKEDIAKTFKKYATTYVTSYGPAFWQWANDTLIDEKGNPFGDRPYGSWANGSAMRVSGAAWFSTDIFDCLNKAEQSSIVTHDHPEAVRAAKAVAFAIFAGRSGFKKDEIKDLIEKIFRYDLSNDLENIRLTSEFTVEAKISVPRAILSALASTSFEDSISNAISLGGDADTEAAIAGCIAEVIYLNNDKEIEIWTKKIEEFIPENLYKDFIDVMNKRKEINFKKLKHEDIDLIKKWDDTEIKQYMMKKNLNYFPTESFDEMADNLLKIVKNAENKDKKKTIFRKCLGFFKNLN